MTGKMQAPPCGKFKVNQESWAMSQQICMRRGRKRGIHIDNCQDGKDLLCRLTALITKHRDRICLTYRGVHSLKNRKGG